MEALACPTKHRANHPVAHRNVGGRTSVMIKPSPGYYFFMAALFGAVSIIMLFSAYWSFEAENGMRVFVSLSFAIAGALLARACYRRAQTLRREEPIQPPETTRGK